MLKALLWGNPNSATDSARGVVSATHHLEKGWAQIDVGWGGASLHIPICHVVVWASRAVLA